jgi:hypothetical protein
MSSFSLEEKKPLTSSAFIIDSTAAVKKTRSALCRGSTLEKSAKQHPEEDQGLASSGFMPV